MRAGGYVTEIPYTFGHHGEMAPARLAMALILAGVRPPPGLLSGRDLAWCELGFGQGVTLAVLAAANPGIRFHGTDINPAHAAFAAGLASAAGLENLSVAAEDFADYAARADLPAFDVVTLHGVWSWVGPAERAAIVGILRDRLKPGGICHIAYNALPGLAPLLPLRALMKGSLDRDTGPLADRIGRAVAFAGTLRGQGARYFQTNPAADDRLRGLAGRPVAYLAHEYFNEHWTPDYVTDVAGALVAAGLTFAGPTRVADRLDTPAGGPLAVGVAAILDGLADPLFREMAGDFLTNRPFRRDLFVKDPAPLTPAEREDMLEALPFAPLTAPHRLPGGGSLPHGEAVLDRAAVAPLLERIGPAGRAGLVPTALGHLAPAADPGSVAGRMDACARFNAVVLAQSRTGDTVGALASPVLGAGMELDRVERLFLLALREGAEPPAFALEALTASGAGVDREGRPLTGAAALEELADRWALFRNARLPVLDRLEVG